MMPQKPELQDSPDSGDAETVPSPIERRRGPRLRPADVPWITAVRLYPGEVVRLVDISTTGALIDTQVRLSPGHPSALLVSGADYPDHIRGCVVRSQVVSVIGGEGLVYRAGLTFDQHVNLGLPDSRPVAPPGGDGESDGKPVRDRRAHPRVRGPFDGLWTGTTGSHLVRIRNISEVGCWVDTLSPVATGDWVSATVFFSATRRAWVVGRVIAVEPQQGCVVRFLNMTAEHRQALRAEIQAHLASSHADAQQPLLTRITADLVSLVPRPFDPGPATAARPVVVNEW